MDELRDIHGEPFRWDDPPGRRAELDAYYARLYGLARDELRYTPFGVEPKEVYGEDFPGETFRVLKEKEVKQFGEYRTRRLVLGPGIICLGSLVIRWLAVWMRR